MQVLLVDDQRSLFSAEGLLEILKSEEGALPSEGGPKRESETRAHSAYLILDIGHNPQRSEIVLVFEGQRGYWTLPGGGGPAGETPRMTVVREVLEECSYRIDVPEENLMLALTPAGEAHTFVFTKWNPAVRADSLRAGFEIDRVGSFSRAEIEQMRKEGKIHEKYFSFIKFYWDEVFGDTSPRAEK